MLYEVWDDEKGTKVADAMPADKAKEFALDRDPNGIKLFLEDGDGNQLGWNANSDPPGWEAL
jgi:hypothetical protein